jgi:hypothetical protein
LLVLQGISPSSVNDVLSFHVNDLLSSPISDVLSSYTLRDPASGSFSTRLFWRDWGGPSAAPKGIVYLFT